MTRDVLLFLSETSSLGRSQTSSRKSVCCVEGFKNNNNHNPIKWRGTRVGGKKTSGLSVAAIEERINLPDAADKKKRRAARRKFSLFRKRCSSSLKWNLERKTMKSSTLNSSSMKRRTLGIITETRGQRSFVSGLTIGGQVDLMEND